MITVEQIGIMFNVERAEHTGVLVLSVNGQEIALSISPEEAEALMTQQLLKEETPDVP